MSSRPTGVLAMAYGTAAGPEDIERYYTDIRGGRAPAPEHLQELKERYAAIGNRFPLLDITRRQAAALERELNATDPGAYRLYLGMKHSSPFIADGVAAMRADGIERAIGLVLAPHWSGMSVDTYAERVGRAVAETGAGPAFTFIRHWYENPLFLDLLAARVIDAMSHLLPPAREGATVIFSAHSLPTRTLADGSQRCKLCTAPACQAWCGYIEQLQDTANRVAGRLGLRSFAIGWQSAGRTDDPWWEPSVEDLIRGLASNGSKAVVCCSAGFVADHLEVLYDLDIEARQVAEQAGLAFVRTEMPNDDPAFIRALAAVVRETQ